MMIYRRSQRGTLILFSVGFACLIVLFALLFGPFHIVPFLVLILLLLCLALFSSLTVEVTDRAVTVRFGVGPINRRFPIREIRGVEIVRNRWYFGWGIHRLREGWLYNVSGLDAVELTMADGRRHRIGTDQPRELRDAIQGALGGAF